MPNLYLENCIYMYIIAWFLRPDFFAELRRLHFRLTLIYLRFSGLPVGGGGAIAGSSSVGFGVN